MKLVGQFAIATAFVLVAVNCLGIQPVVDIPSWPPSTSDF